MDFAIKLAWTYFRGRRQSLARFTAIAAITGIAVGVASLIIAQSLARGFQREMQDKILKNTAHIAVFRTDGAEIANWPELKRDLETIENITEVVPTTYESAVITGQRKTDYVVLRAFEKGDAESGPVKISLGAELAEKIRAKPGDWVEIIFPGQNGSSPLSSKAVVSDIFRTGLFEYDSTWAYVSFNDLARIAGKATFDPTVLNIKLRDLYATDKSASLIRERISSPDFRVVDWQEANRPLFAAMMLERKIVMAIILIIVFIAALNITTTLALLVNERRLDIAVLRTCGMKARGLMLTFILEGLFLGAAGTAAGIFTGLIFCHLANHFRFISLPVEVYSISFVRLHPLFSEVAIIALSALAICLLATIYPAWRATKIKPLENIRNS